MKTPDWYDLHVKGFKDRLLDEIVYYKQLKIENKSTTEFVEELLRAYFVSGNLRSKYDVLQVFKQDATIVELLEHPLIKEFLVNHAEFVDFYDRFIKSEQEKVLHPSPKIVPLPTSYTRTEYVDEKDTVVMVNRYPNNRFCWGKWIGREFQCCSVDYVDQFLAQGDLDKVALGENWKSIKRSV